MNIQICNRLNPLTLISFCLALFMISSSILAVPASPHLQEKVQPDGSKVNVKLKGDEFFYWHEDSEGFVVKKDKADKTWKYAKPSIDSAKFEIIKDAVLGKAKPKALGLKRRDLPSKEKIYQKVKAKWGEKYARHIKRKIFKKVEIKQKNEGKEKVENKKTVTGGNTQK